jgi:hypothetical protein
MQMMGVDETVINEARKELSLGTIEVYKENMVAVKAFMMCDLRFQAGMSVIYTGIDKSECMTILREMGFKGEELLEHMLKAMILSSKASELLNNRAKK